MALSGCGSDDPAMGPHGTDTNDTEAVPSAPFSAGASRTCELVDGRVRVWGANLEGWQPEPRWLDLDASGAVELSCQGLGGCVVDAGGGVQCWDQDDGSTAVNVVAYDVSGAGGLSSAGGAACMLADEGLVCSVTSAGSHFSGLGLGLVVVESVVDPAAVDLGPFGGCAVDGAGDVWCFGESTLAQTGQVNASVPPTRIVGLPPMHDVAVGNAMACAWTDTGAAWCWGKQVGNLEFLPPSEVLADGVVEMAVASIASPVSQGYSWCALDADGAARCGGPDEAERPDVSSIQLTELQSGMDHMCGRGIQGGLWCWGWDVDAENVPADRQWSATPVDLLTWTD